MSASAPGIFLYRNRRGSYNKVLNEKARNGLFPTCTYCEDFLADNYEVDIEDIHEAMLELRQQKHVFECGPMVSFNEPRWVRI